MFIGFKGSFSLANSVYLLLLLAVYLKSIVSFKNKVPHISIFKLFRAGTPYYFRIYLVDERSNVNLKKKMKITCNICTE